MSAGTITLPKASEHHIQQKVKKKSLVEALSCLRTGLIKYVVQVSITTFNSLARK